ncbi:P-loop NTPase fold protein [Streptomyces sp. NPDC001904]|uniref:P-loop NTPase fold protein n=1 Tax=Streptomyces sp. NPDC001904 TaxID=3154531 RepID=UPI0033174A85
MPDSQLQPGVTATRAQIKDVYGGSTQGGIVPSNPSNSVLIFSDPAVGHRYGYHDGWVDDEAGGRVFEYTGAGAVGDQTFTGGNRAIVNHVEAGRVLRVFVAAGTAPGSQAKLHRYEGEFKVDDVQPYVRREAQGGDGAMREVIVFRLRPADPVGNVVEFRTPLASLHSDSSTTNDLLGNQEEVDRLAKLSLATTTAPPLAIALLGEWGAGKSSFMDQMYERITEIKELSGQSGVAESAFVSEVKQVRFNAWHYSDEHIWPGLIGELFRVLAEVPAGDEAPSEGVEAQRAGYKSRLDGLRERSRKLDEDLQQAGDLQPRGLLAWLSSPRELWPLLRAKFREIRHQILGLGIVALILLVLIVAYIIWGRPLVQPKIAAIVASAIALWPIGKVVSVARNFLSKQREFIDKWQGDLQKSQSDLQSEIVATEASLAEVDPAVRLSSFLTDRGAGNSYQAYQGLIAMVHEDLTNLDKALLAAHEDWIATGSTEDRPLQRVILYIDDLDRCPPDRVVEVLAAVHLMLAFPLFVVVVAIDPRWLIRCLKHRHKDLFSNPSDIGHGEVEDVATPVDYLDKIFQIALTVPPATPEKTSRLLEALLDAPDIDDQPMTSEVGEEEVASSGGEAGAAAAISPDEAEEAAMSAAMGAAMDELNPAQMQLTSPESTYMIRLSELLPTPRATKKLVNLYRLVRMGVDGDDMPRFLGSLPDRPGEYQVVQLLLALLVGHPEQASQLFRLILNASPTGKITDVLRESPEAVDMGLQVADLIDRINAETAVETDVETHQRWCPALARYSFYTRSLRG